MDKNAIELIGVSKSFKLQRWNVKNSSLGPKIITPVDNVSLTIKKQKMIGIIGKNGSGKTTLLRIIAGIYKPNSGSVETHGRISPLLQLGTGFQGDLDARANVIMNAMLLGIPKSQMMQNVDSI